MILWNFLMYLFFYSTLCYTEWYVNQSLDIKEGTQLYADIYLGLLALMQNGCYEIRYGLNPQI